MPAPRRGQSGNNDAVLETQGSYPAGSANGLERAVRQGQKRDSRSEQPRAGYGQIPLRRPHGFDLTSLAKAATQDRAAWHARVGQELDGLAIGCP
jgi:hypothetical protein